MLRTHSTLSLKLSALALALAFQGAAFAAQSPAQTAPAQVAAADGACQPGQHKHHRMHGHHHGAAMLIPGYGPIGEKTLASLELNDSQSELLKSAQAAGKDLRQTRRSTMKDAWKARGQQLSSGKIDPHQAVEQRRSAFRDAGQAHAAVEQKWLALWDALNPGQQEKVVAALNQRAQKRAARHHGGHKAPRAESGTDAS